MVLFRRSRRSSAVHLAEAPSEAGARTQAIAEAMLRRARTPEEMDELLWILRNYAYGYHRPAIVAAALSAHCVGDFVEPVDVAAVAAAAAVRLKRARVN